MKDEGIAQNTLVVFTSDNGQIKRPEMFKAIKYDTALVKPWDGGSAGPLRGGKFSVYEGRVRVPGIIHRDGKIKGGRVNHK